MIRLTFLGAAETVTGSKYLLEVDGAKLLIDCGLFQGLKQLREKNWEKLPLKHSEIDCVLLTHAHVDHVGYLPRFVKDGFRGPVYCTPATESIAELLLLDTAHIQTEDARYANRKGFSRHKPALPLYDEQDAQRALRRFRTVQREEWFQPVPPVSARYHDTGHLLGSSMIEVVAQAAGQTVRLLFSGDVGRYDAPLYHDPVEPPACDYLICESTYGDRDHPEANVMDRLTEIVLAAVARGGVMVVASFAVGRAQQLIYLLQILMEEKRIPQLPIYLDSPMAVSGMKLYQYHASEHDLSEGLAVSANYAFSDRHVHLCKTADESKAINNVDTPAVIISSSGMMTGGRILHHLKKRLPDKRNTIVLGGFMAAGTRGRSLQDGAKTLHLHGMDVPVKAKIVEMSAMSGHADRSELLRWLQPLAEPKQTFITHGELHSANALAAQLQTTRGWETVVPKLGQSFEL